MPPHFDLLVGATDHGQDAILPPHGEITGPEGTDIVGRHEALGGERLIAPIAR